MYKAHFFFRPLLLPALYLLLSLIAPSLVSAQGTPSLPEIPGWDCGTLRTTNFDTVSGNQGTWLQRDYRSASGASFRATLMTGKGPSMPGFPPDGIDTNDGFIGVGSSYRTLEICGYRATAEIHPVLGASVAVKLADGYLTLESGPYGMSAEELIDVSSQLVSSMPK